MGFLRKLFGKQDETAAAASPAPPSNPPPTIPEVSTADFMAEWQNENRPVLLDVRESYEWQQMHVPGSQHMPMNQLPAQLHKLDKTADIVVICASGNRSYSVTAFLQQNGFRARNLKGGIMHWARSGGQVESGQ